MSSASIITSTFCERFPHSAKLAARSRAVFPNGVTHDARHLTPFPVFVDQASGARKRTVDGPELIDYCVGHGALLLGHGHPEVVQAVQSQMARGTHFSACHELEVRLGETVQQLIPSAELVRFTNSGTEATLMALRIARLVTGRRKVVKFIGHFHGWHDWLVPAAYAPYDPRDWSMPGLAGGVLEELVVVPPNDLAALEQVLVEQQPAAVILEPTGGHWGTVPMGGTFLRGVRELTARHQSLLIFDEVITGFRVHPGGAQAAYDVRPDLTTLAKILAGGLPGGALVGRADLLETLAFDNPRGQKIKHPGTFNGNPLSAAAGCAALKLVATGTPSQLANAVAQELRRGLNALFANRRAPFIAYGDFSMIHILPRYQGPRPNVSESNFIPCDHDYRQLDNKPDAAFTHAFRAALLLGGVDWFGWGGMTSAAHTSDDVTATIAAFDVALSLLQQDGWW